MGNILQALYTCHGCGIKDRAVTVRHRAEGEDIARWMDNVARLVGIDHGLQSPSCRHGRCDLKIPVIDVNKPIGTPENHP